VDAQHNRIVESSDDQSDTVRFVLQLRVKKAKEEVRNTGQTNREREERRADLNVRRSRNQVQRSSNIFVFHPTLNKLGEQYAKRKTEQNGTKPKTNTHTSRSFKVLLTSFKQRMTSEKEASMKGLPEEKKGKFKQSEGVKQTQ
jgi:hypothetical protein